MSSTRGWQDYRPDIVIIKELVEENVVEHAAGMLFKIYILMEMQRCTLIGVLFVGNSYIVGGFASNPHYDSLADYLLPMFLWRFIYDFGRSIWLWY